MAKMVNSWNEWDPLKRVILGRIENSCQPKTDVSWWYDCEKSNYPYGRLPQDYEEKAIGQMENFKKILESRGIVVDQCDEINWNQSAKTPDWEVPVMHGTMPPRDVLMAVGNEILEATMSIRARFFDYVAYRSILNRYFKEDPEFMWMAAPKPRLTEDSYDTEYFYNFYKVWDLETKMKRAQERRWQQTDNEPLFDVADGMRLGKDIIWQVSCVSNEPGRNWLRRYFEAKGMRFHEVQFSGDPLLWHIDINILPLRPGLMMVNPELQPMGTDFAELMKRNDWEVIESARPVHHYDITCGSVNERVGTSWISMNCLSLDEKTVCVEGHETAYQDQLDKLGFNVIPVPFDGVLPFGGELHCSTCDVHREGDCKDYFPNQVSGF
jgi:glycine amidinotransferase